MSLSIGLSGQGTAPTGSETISGGSFAIGVNLSGMEYNADQPAHANYNYAIPTLAELQYYQSQGTDLIRLPFAWEHLQPTLGGALDPTYLGELQVVVNEAASLGMKVILDAHDYGGYGSNKLGDGTLTDAEFANMWQQLAGVFAGNPGIAGYDLMNEPNGMPNAQAWPDAAQAAITAIRTVDTSTAIYVEGDDWSSAGSWSQVNSGLASLYDPSNNLIFSAHLYLDSDNSGTHFDWTQQASQGVTTDLGVQRLSDFVSWLQANNLKGDIGEIGAGNDNTNWLISLDNTLAYAQANNLQVTYWAGGPWWGTYPMSVEPVNGVPAPQMAVLDKYSGDMETVTSAALAGQSDADSTIYLSENDVTLATTTTDSSGNWTVTLTGLANGTHTIVASEVPPSTDGTIAAISFILATPSSSSSSGDSSDNGSSSGDSSSGGGNSSSSNNTPPSIPAVTVVVAAANETLSGAVGQNVYRFVDGDGTDTISNFQAGSGGDTVQLMGASNFTLSNYFVNDILWDNGAFSPFLWDMNGSRVIGATAMGGAPGAMVLFGYHIAAVGDFNGDGISDLLLASNTPSPFAPAIIWSTSGGVVDAGAELNYGATSTKAWTGDFNGDGTSDILWDNGSATPYLWEMKNNQVIAAGALGGAPGSIVMPGYHIAGIGDFNGDGKSDILLLANTPSPFSPAVIWFMNGFAGGAVALPYGATPANAWVGDFNGDGKSDILWDNGSSTPVLWEMNGPTVIGVGILGGAYGSTVMPGYHIAGVGDFNGDGDTDILWAANNPSPYSPAIIWFMNGTSVSGAVLAYGATPTTAFIGNFNVDGAKISSGSTQIVLSGVNESSLTANNIEISSTTKDYSGQSAGVTANLATGASSVSGDNLTDYQNVIGTAENDTLTGYGPNYTSTLTGNGGSDTYLFGAGDGSVAIVNGVSSSNSAAGEVEFAPGITDNNLWFAQVGNNLVIDVLGSTDQVTLTNWYSNAYSQTAEIVDGNGLKLDASLNNLVQAMATFSAAHPAFDPQTANSTLPNNTALQNAVLAAWHN